jgi:hypothetical protein
MTAVAAGANHTLALRSDGAVLAWGYDVNGALGDGTAGGSDPTPDPVLGLSNVAAIGAGGLHSLAVRSNGSVWSWGGNGYGQLGRSAPISGDAVAAAVPGLSGASAVDGGIAHSLARLSDGTAKAWGNNAGGQLGSGTFTGGSTAVTVLGLGDITAIDTNGHHTLGLSETTVPIGEEVTSTVPAGGTVSTDPEDNGVTDADPVETTITSPVAGTITIEEAPVAGTPPTGFTLAGQGITITAPTATAGNPLILVFQIDASRIPPPQTAISILVLRNGVAVQHCTGGPGIASPDPCVASRQVGPGGDAVVTVRTSQASLWELGFAAPVADAGGPYTVQEGSGVQLDATASTGTAPLTFDWGVDPSIDDPTSATPTFTGLDDGHIILSLGVTDASGVSAIADTMVDVTNADPEASLELPTGPTAALDPATIDVIFTDAGANDTHDVAIDWGDDESSTPAVTEADGNGSASASHAYDLPGSYDVTVTVTDDDGGIDEISGVLEIRERYTFTGFFAPIDNPPTVNIGKAGRTYSAKFRLTDMDGDSVTSVSAIAAITAKSTSCSVFTGDPTDSLEATSAGNGGLRYDSASQQFIYDWKTPAARGCYTLFVGFDSGQAREKAFFNLR